MRLVCISDTHNSHKSMRIPAGDVLIHAGDATGQGTRPEVERFLAWFASQPHPNKILIAGNHDWLFQRNPGMGAQLLSAHKGITYLQDSGVEIDGIRFWGSPWQPWFQDWAFNLPRGGPALRDIWNKIPIDTEVLITHGPPYGVLDRVRSEPHLGCEELKIRLATLNLQVHIFGHIHDSYGVAQSRTTTYVNACNCNEQYETRNMPIVLDLGVAGVTVHHTEPNERLESFLQLQSSLDNLNDEVRKEVHCGLLPRHIHGLEEMARLRGVEVEALLQDYIERGLQADIARQIRVENKPSRRTIPFMWLADSNTDNSATER